MAIYSSFFDLPGPSKTLWIRGTTSTEAIAEAHPPAFYIAPFLIERLASCEWHVANPTDITDRRSLGFLGQETPIERRGECTVPSIKPGFQEPGYLPCSGAFRIDSSSNLKSLWLSLVSEPVFFLGTRCFLESPLDTHFPGPQNCFL
jgi:hypothetical protein